jgi:hypothetical protein
MRKWTFETIETTSNYDFALEVLRERLKNHPRQFSPFAKKLKESIEYFEKLKLDL